MVTELCELTGYCLAETQQGPHEERLIDDIFQKRKYQPLARPVAKESDLVNVFLGISLQQIVDVDEKNEMLHTNMWLNYRWYDYNLGWNASEYGGVQSIRLPAKFIWTPDILMYNSADEDIDSKFPTNIVVRSTGQCEWVPLGLFISSCSINIKWFPFDDQHCTMKFGSWTYDGTKLNLTLIDETSPKIDLSTYTESGEWIILDAPAVRHNITYECCPEPYIDIIFSLHLRRRTLYYGFNLIIPCALISSLALLTFLLPPDAGEKISLGITILLSLSVFSLIVAESVPSTSLAVPLVGIYFTVIMVLCAISVAITVIVLNFHHRNSDTHDMPIWVKKIVCEWLAWALRMSRPGHDLSREFLLQKAHMRELESRNPPSRSLLSNIRDVDNSIPVNVNDMYMRCTRLEEGGLHNVRNELLAILNELRFITRKIKDNNESDEVTGDWKFAAMVIDRLFFWIFSVAFVITTIGIFFSAPNLTG
ncbi:hypothetical protein NP493_514g00017 [Ridgeia piscesae]|uniref:Uncharacterized protein n=1 Tax=Ridgeia piscesae TaxID=27915 RepID=A0AAD9KWP4_RIDPI|nr:hypothetical protein NP493_514g00017 [Ridgeia piscesae]